VSARLRFALGESEQMAKLRNGLPDSDDPVRIYTMLRSRRHPVALKMGDLDVWLEELSFCL
jgi:hypothetical protein